MNTAGRNIVIDIPTLIAISVVAWALANILHEIVGHGGAALLLDIPFKAASTTTIYLDWDQIQSAGQSRIIHAAATVVNLVTGGMALLLLLSPRVTDSAWRYFLWLFATFSLIVVVMNLVSAPLIGGGDWTVFLRDMEPRRAYMALILGVGVLVAALGYILPLRIWMPNLKGNLPVQLQVTVIPVITLVVVQTLSLLGSPFIKAPPAYNPLLASVFLYLHFIVWAILVNVIPVPRSSAPAESIVLPRSGVWLAMGLVVFLFFALVLGPGLGPLSDDPRLRQAN